MPAPSTADAVEGSRAKADKIATVKLPVWARALDVVAIIIGADDREARSRRYGR